MLMKTPVPSPDMAAPWTAGDAAALRPRLPPMAPVSEANTAAAQNAPLEPAAGVFSTSTQQGSSFSDAKMQQSTASQAPIQHDTITINREGGRPAPY
jgi:hypothetical protein